MGLPSLSGGSATGLSATGALGGLPVVTVHDVGPHDSHSLKRIAVAARIVTPRQISRYMNSVSGDARSFCAGRRKVSPRTVKSHRNVRVTHEHRTETIACKDTTRQSRRKRPVTRVRLLDALERAFENLIPLGITLNLSMLRRLSEFFLQFTACLFACHRCANCCSGYRLQYAIAR